MQKALLIGFVLSVPLIGQQAWTITTSGGSPYVLSTNSVNFSTKWNGVAATPPPNSKPANFVYPIKISDIVNNGSPFVIKTINPPLIVSSNSDWNLTDLVEGKHQLRTEWGTSNGPTNTWYGPTSMDGIFYVDLTDPRTVLQLSNGALTCSASDNIGISRIELWADSGSGYQSPYKTISVANSPGILNYSTVASLPSVYGNIQIMARVYDLSGRSFTSPSVGVSLFQVTAIAGPGGSITPEGTTSVLSAGNLSYTISPSSGNSITKLLVDGVEIVAASGATGPYTHSLSNISSNHSINAQFGTTVSCGIHGECGLGGTIKCTPNSGERTSVREFGTGYTWGVQGSSTVSLSAAPNPGYQVKFLMLDGNQIPGAAGSTIPYVFTLKTNTSGHSIACYYNSINMLSKGVAVSGQSISVNFFFNIRSREYGQPEYFVYSTDSLLANVVEYAIFDSTTDYIQHEVRTAGSFPYDYVPARRNGAPGWTIRSMKSGANGCLRVKYSNGSFGETYFILP